jgi:hypothetical protein
MMHVTQHPEGNHVAERTRRGSASHRRTYRRAVCCHAELSTPARGEALQHQSPLPTFLRSGEREVDRSSCSMRAQGPPRAFSEPWSFSLRAVVSTGEECQ